MNDAKEIEAFERLLGVCRRLRGPDGCPWDREQTLESMTPYLLEEAAEVGQAVAEGARNRSRKSSATTCSSASSASSVLRERAGIGLAESLDRAAEKLVRRHPHVYGGAPVRDGGAAYHQWQQLKKQEHGGSLLGGQPPGLAALVAAYRSQEKASAVGFDWPEASGPLAKVREEVEEIALEIDRSDARASAREVGDLLFAVVNLARHLGVDPERELASATRRFRERFHHIERRLAEQGRSFKGTALSGAGCAVGRGQEPRETEGESMSENPGREAALFLQLVIGLQQSGMVALGKLMNPMTRTIEKNLDAARDAIDVLAASRPHPGQPRARRGARAASGAHRSPAQLRGRAEASGKDRLNGESASAG